MSIDLSPAASRNAQALVAAGRFHSVEEAIDAALQALISDDQQPPWTAELQRAVDEGARAVANNDFASEAQLDALFAQYSLRSA